MRVTKKECRRLHFPTRDNEINMLVASLMNNEMSSRKKILNVRTF